MPTKLNIKKLKDFAATMPRNSVLRDILLSETDEIDVSIFLDRLPIWLRLAEYFCETTVSQKGYSAKLWFRRITIDFMEVPKIWM